MTDKAESFANFANNFSEPFLCRLKAVGEESIEVIIPNRGKFLYSKEDIRQYACLKQIYQKITQTQNFFKVMNQEIYDPCFLALVAFVHLSLTHGYGAIHLEYLDRRTLMLTQTFTYRIPIIR